ncbi:AmmeMemoRadiSam system protein A [Natronoglycomyces albus]|uniref:AmmeMemoRadiSam system protein A n=1 Tax=Natronoglycomyces albus TaxID=2811108 RepID=A0A895XSH8_9ACTN|nr:AmmeMemoRadiSam system protein A [Natronoglycomyces albus]QSB04588.1 AmmeMemoRadiSam system protein A [Natronoglycomyces albus]
MSELANILCTLARDAIETTLHGGNTADLVASSKDAVDESDRDFMGDPGATFVTLIRDGKLRGCIGSLRAVRSLAADVARNASLAAADPRMEPVTLEELPDIHISISVLSKPTPWHVDNFRQLCAGLQPGIDGVTLRDGSRHATYLPAVWEHLPDPERFVASLLKKGGWPEEFWENMRVVGRPWPPAMAVERYKTTTYEEPRTQ